MIEHRNFTSVIVLKQITFGSLALLIMTHFEVQSRFGESS